MSEISLPSIKLEPRRDLQSFLRHLHTAFGSRCQEHLGENGLLGFCVTDDQWATLPGVATPDVDNVGQFIIAHRPAVIFIPPPDLGATAAVLKQYEISFRRNAAISEALRQLKTSIIAAVPDSIIDELSDPTLGLVAVSCNQIISHLRQRYGIFLASDFENFRLALDEKIGSRTFSELSAAHRLLHVQFTSAGQGLSEIDKCRYLRAAIGTNIAMQTAVTSYLTQHPQIVQQTFAGIVLHITEQAPNFAITPNDLGYAAATIAIPEAAPQFFESSAFAAFLDRRISAAIPKLASKHRLYCYMHGYNNHSSPKCNKMEANKSFTPDMRAATTHTDVKGGSVRNL